MLTTTASTPPAAPRHVRHDGERHYCRNPRCRSKLETPTENPGHAFCCRGCRESYYKVRCIVCERERKSSPTGMLCRRQKCRIEYRRYPIKFSSPWAPKSAQTAKDTCGVLLASTNAHSTDTFWRDRSGRGWRWIAATDCLRLLSREGIEVARIVAEAPGWLLAHPRVQPAPPIEPIEEAKKRALVLALAALPNSRRAQSAPNHSPLFERNTGPLNLLGGFRWPAPHLDRELRRKILRAEAGDVMTAGAVA